MICSYEGDKEDSEADSDHDEGDLRWGGYSGSSGAPFGADAGAAFCDCDCLSRPCSLLDVRPTVVSAWPPSRACCRVYVVDRLIQYEYCSFERQHIEVTVVAGNWNLNLD